MTYFWAKTTPEGNPGISVYDHMVNVGCVARLIAEASPEILARFNLHSSMICALAALHDLGKISPGFQQKCASWLEENGFAKLAERWSWATAMEQDHGEVSHAAIQAFLLETGADRNTAKFVSAALGGHHGKLVQPDSRGYRPKGLISETATQINWDAARMANARMVWEHFAATGVPVELDVDSPSLWWLAGLTSVADWIGSDEDYFPPDGRTGDKDPASLAVKALAALGFAPLALEKNLSFEAIFGFPPNDMQSKASNAITGPGVYIIEAPMGMGKTEAALGAAYRLLSAGKANGVYFALPTQATSNRIHLRMDEFLKRIALETPTPEAPGSRLLHGNSWLMGKGLKLYPAASGEQGKASDDARTGRDWFASPKRALIAPFGVGTVDQALLGVVAAKHFFVRQFALAGKVVIIDEVHSYDLYTGTLINKLITTLEGLGSTVIVLSATLTGKRRGEIVKTADFSDEAEAPYPLITGQTEGTVFEPVAADPPEERTVAVDFITGDYAAEEAVRLARKGGAVLWICNTVDAAQKQYRRIRRIKELAGDGFPAGLLHARFPFWRREELENEWMERFGKDGTTRCGSVLVSTQIVEQSVDLDADLLITELAPTDMLLQRLGRLWRHEREGRPVDDARVCVVEEKKSLDEFRSMKPAEITKALGGKAKVYAPYILLRSLEVWKAQPQVSIPSQIRSLLESTYDDRDDEPDPWQKLSDEWFGTDSAKKMIAYRNSNLWQAALDDVEGRQTRLNEIETVSVVLCRSICKREAVFMDGSTAVLGGDVFRPETARAIHRRLVKVPQYHFDRVEHCKAFSEYLLGPQTVGIVTESGSVEVKGLKDGIHLSYSDELGLVIQKASAKEDL